MGGKIRAKTLSLCLRKYTLMDDLTNRCYKILIEFYRKWYPDPEIMVDFVIKRLSKNKGLSEKEALLYICEKMGVRVLSIAQIFKESLHTLLKNGALITPGIISTSLEIILLSFIILLEKSEVYFTFFNSLFLLSLIFSLGRAIEGSLIVPSIVISKKNKLRIGDIASFSSVMFNKIFPRFLIVEELSFLLAFLPHVFHHYNYKGFTEFMLTFIKNNFLISVFSLMFVYLPLKIFLVLKVLDNLYYKRKMSLITNRYILIVIFYNIIIFMMTIYLMNLLLTITSSLTLLLILKIPYTVFLWIFLAKFHLITKI